MLRFLTPWLWAICAAVAQTQTQYTISTSAGAVLPPAGAKGAAVSIAYPYRLILDSANSVYFTRDANVFKLDRFGSLSVVAGTGKSGCSGDGGAATAAQLTQPTGIAMDAAGTVYVADGGCQSIRKIDGHGIITTFATGAKNQLIGLGGMVLDTGGNLYIAQSRVLTGVTFSSSARGLVNSYAGSSDVLKVSPVGTIAVAAGTGTVGFAGDGQAATQALLGDPLDVALDSSGNLYIADTNNARIRMVNSQGIISTFAGVGTHIDDFGFPIATDSGDNNSPQNASIGYPYSLAVAPTGIYMGLATGVIRAVQQGAMHTVAGSPSGQSLAPGLPVSGVVISYPTSIAVDVNGTMYATAGDAIWKLPPGGAVVQFAGNGHYNGSGDGGPASMAQFGPAGYFARDAAGGIVLADPDNNEIRRIAPDGTVTRVAGTGNRGPSPADGVQALAADLNSPRFIALDAAGNLYFGDSPKVRKIAPNGVMSTVAGNGEYGNTGDEGPATQATLEYVAGLALDPAGNLYITTSSFGDAPGAIRKVTTDGIIHSIGQSLYAGSICADRSGNVYVAYALGPSGTAPVAILKIAPGGVKTTFAGGGRSDPGDGGPATGALLPNVGQMTFDSAGNLYFESTGRIRKVDTQGIIGTIAGTGQPGYTGDGGPALSAQTFGIGGGIAVDPKGIVYFAESYNYGIAYPSVGVPAAGAVRVLTPQVTPPPPTGPAIGSVVNAASNISGPVAPGEIVVIYGSGFGPAQGVSNGPDAAGVYGGVVAGTSVLFNGKPGPMIYSYPGQAAAVVPYGVSGSSVQVAVQYQGAASAAVSVPVAAANPALLTPGSGKGQAAAINQDGPLNGPANPAPVSSIILLFATGEGQTSPPGMDGQVTGSTLPKPLLPVTVTIGGQPATVLYAGEAPLEIAGVMQLNVQIPAGIQTGNQVPVQVQVGTALSPSGVTIAVK